MFPGEVEKLSTTGLWKTLREEIYAFDVLRRFPFHQMDLDQWHGLVSFDLLLSHS